MSTENSKERFSQIIKDYKIFAKDPTDPDWMRYAYAWKTFVDETEKKYGDKGLGETGAVLLVIRDNESDELWNIKMKALSVSVSGQYMPAEIEINDAESKRENYDILKQLQRSKSVIGSGPSIIYISKDDYQDNKNLFSEESLKSFGATKVQIGLDEGTQSLSFNTNIMNATNRRGREIDSYYNSAETPEQALQNIINLVDASKETSPYREIHNILDNDVCTCNEIARKKIVDPDAGIIAASPVVHSGGSVGTTPKGLEKPDIIIPNLSSILKQPIEVSFFNPSISPLGKVGKNGSVIKI